MDGSVVAVLVAFMLHGGLMWYKIGRMEQKLSDLCREVRGKNTDDKGG